ERYALLRDGFRAAGVSIGQPEYDELALLCMLSLPIDRLVATVAHYRERLAADAWLPSRNHFSLATNLAFVHLAGADAVLGPLADVKLLLDMQAIVAARAAAAAAAAV